MTAFEALKEIKKGISYGFYDGKSLGYYKKHFELIKKELEALEIIKENVMSFVSLEYEDYCNEYRVYDNEMYQYKILSKEKFNLLKEVLDNEHK